MASGAAGVGVSRRGGGGGLLLHRAVLLLLSLLVSVPLADARKGRSSLSNGIITFGPDAHPVPADQVVRRQAVVKAVLPANYGRSMPLQFDIKSRSGVQPRGGVATEPGPGVGVSAGARSVALPAQGVTNSSSAWTASSRSLNGRTVCSNDPTLRRFDNTGAFTSVCRVYTNKPDDDTTDNYRRVGMCSGTFITSKHVLLAAHCISLLGGEKDMVLDENGRYGTVCCAPGSDDNPNSCASDAEFDIINAAYQEGWINGDDNNDGALLKVARQSRTRRDIGIPLKWGSIIRNPCSKRTFEWSGFPYADERLEGCDVNWQGKMRYTISKQVPYSCPDANTGDQVTLRGSGCGGMSGGPVLNRYDNFVIGIVSTTTSECYDGRGTMRFSQLAVKEGVGGVYVTGLLDAIP